MPFYDHHEVEDITGIGLQWMRETAQYHIDTILRLHPTARSLLEVGPGPGLFGQVWHSTGREYICQEGSPRLAARLRSEGVTVHEAMAPPILAPSESVDIAYASNVLEHMHHAGLAIQLIEEMVRIVHSGGLVCIETPDITGAGLLFWDVDYTHNFVTSERRVRQLFQDSDLEIVHTISMSGPYSGVLAEVIAWAARLIPHRLLMAITPRSWKPERILRGKTTFLKQVFIIGRKPD